MLKPENVTHIVVHCSYTPPSMDVDVRTIDRWHRVRGWLMVGYHLVIRRDGTAENGRPLNMVGAHVSGYNNRSVGVCLVGGMKEGTAGAHPVDETNFTPEQYTTLAIVVRTLKDKFPNAVVVGHNDLTRTKTCPTFDVKAWAASLNL
ncbi:MAG: N-acetylmuramoyl-L-alanine amidase [Parvibaculum sp.]|nr:N-acetylmuramoyl-L-alanine amidase [Parvibaculum sp.]MDO8839665.1 N-acetylmuramoyl-L-alanine amidase [Parvibaculum sp.]